MRKPECGMSFDKRLLRIHCLIVLFMFGFKFLPPVGQITPLGMSLLGIFIGAIIGWCTIGFVFPCLAGILALGLSGAYPSFNAMLAATFGFNIAVMMLACLFICAFVEVVNLPAVIIGQMLNMRLARKNGTFFVIVFFMTCYLVSALSNSSLSAYLFMDLHLELAGKADIKEHDRTNSFMALGIIFSSILGEISLPFKPVALLVIGLCQTSSGFMLSFMDYLLYLTSFQLVMLAIFALTGKYLLAINFSGMTNIDFPKIRANVRQKIGLWAIVAMFAAFALSGSDLPFFSDIGLAGISLLALLGLLFIQVDKRPLVDLQDLASHFGWGMYLLTVMLIPFSACLGSQDAGITMTIKDLVNPVLAVLPASFFVVLSIFLTVLLTNILPNMPVAVIFISLMASLGDALAGINVAAASLTIATASFISMASPAANNAAVYVFSFARVVKLPKAMLMGAIASLILCLLTALVYYPILSLLIC